MIQAITGLVTVFFVTRYLSFEEQGYFYAIGSLLSTYILLDFGFSSFLVQVSAQSFSGLSWKRGDLFSLKKQQSSDFYALFKWIFNWYRKLSIISLLFIPIGFLYFSLASNDYKIDWFLPWIVIVFSLSISMPAIGFLAIFEGAGQIQNVYLIRISHYLLNSFFVWILLIIGKGLFAHSIAPLILSLLVYSFLLIKFFPFVRNAFITKKVFHLKKIIYKHQKKVGIAWVGNYFFQHAPVLIIFSFAGPENAGKFGVSMIIANVACSISMSWITAVTPKISDLIYQKKYFEAKLIFNNALLISLILLIVGIILFYFIQISLERYIDTKRILSANQNLLLFIAFGAYHFINAFMIYFRAFKLEPISSLILASSIIILIGGIILVSNYGMNQLIILMTIIYSLLLIYTFVLFKRFSSKKIISS